MTTTAVKKETKTNYNRRTNLKNLVAVHGGLVEFAKMLGYSTTSFFSQMIGKNPTREITEKTARKFEEALGLEFGYFDNDPATQIPDRAKIRKPRDPNVIDVDAVFTPEVQPLALAAGPAVAPVQTDLKLVLDVVRLVGQVCEEVKLTLPPVKFADVVALAYNDAAETGGKPREAHLRQIIKLMGS